MSIHRYSDEEVYPCSWMDHTISGSRAHGKGPFERPLRKCIVNDQGIYAGIVRHVKSCPDCDPEKIIHVFLNQRDRKQVDGIGSGTFLKFANTMCKIRTVSPETLQEIAIRSGERKTIESMWDSLSVRDKIRASHFCNLRRSGTERVAVYGKLWPMLPTHTDSELSDLVVFWEVHNF